MSFVIARFDPAVKYAGFNQFDCQLHPVNKFVKDSLKKQVKQRLSVVCFIVRYKFGLSC